MAQVAGKEALAEGLDAFVLQSSSLLQCWRAKGIQLEYAEVMEHISVLFGIGMLVMAGSNLCECKLQ